jgi:predicted NUDIX family phosphoesterase/dephospho-CoA kinase
LKASCGDAQITVEEVTYLWVAETVLTKHQRPLSARELVNYGLEDGLFPAAGLSHTPQKSMQARLSLDILNNKQSPFVRTSRGRFLLKSQLANNAKEAALPLAVYTAERRGPALTTENVLCVPKSHYSKYLRFQGIGRIGINDPLSFLNSNSVTYFPRVVAEMRNDYKQVITYTIIQHQSKILSFRRGLYNRAASFLRGAQCVGFGGHVNDDDHSLFSASDFGIRQNAIREIGEELMLPSGRPHIDPSALEYLGILNDDSSDVGIRHFAVVLRYWVDDWQLWRKVSRGEASINKLRWLDTVDDEINLSEFEYWSQLVVRRFFPSTMTMVPSFKIQRRKPFEGAHILCVVGPIGSGKSATSRFFAEQCGYDEINSGRVLARLLEMPPIPETDRLTFQAAAENFIAKPDGPSALGSALAGEVENSNSDRILIDGIRHPETLDVLRRSTKIPIALLYVYTPPDVAFEMYRDREGHGEASTTFEEFITLYNAPVESRIRYLLGDADIITFNWLGLEAYSLALEKLAESIHAN